MDHSMDNNIQELKPVKEKKIKKKKKEPKEKKSEKSYEQIVFIKFHYSLEVLYCYYLN